MKKGILLPLLVLLLTACDNGSPTKIAAPASGQSTQHSAEQDALIRQVKANLVFVEGGDFLMGDFGAEHGPEKIQLDTETDSKPLHKVTLSSYSISKFKTTNQEYNIYLKLNKLEKKKEMVN